MSRTYHHNKRTSKYYREKHDVEYERVPSTGKLKYYIQRAGVKPKLKRSYTDFDYYWYKSTPGYWTLQHMTAPKRAKCRNWEKTTVKLFDIEDATICPDYGRKPHFYYW